MASVHDRLRPADRAGPGRHGAGRGVPTSALIVKGHKLRVAVGASNLPQGVPPLPTLLDSLIGVLTVYSDAARPSQVVLPVVPATAL